eukprot:102822_1
MAKLQKSQIVQFDVFKLTTAETIAKYNITFEGETTLIFEDIGARIDIYSNKLGVNPYIDFREKKYAGRDDLLFRLKWRLPYKNEMKLRNIDLENVSMVSLSSCRRDSIFFLSEIEKRKKEFVKKTLQMLYKYSQAMEQDQNESKQLNDENEDNMDNDNIIMFGETKQSETETEMETFDNRNNYDNYPQPKPGYIDFFWFDAYEDPIEEPTQIYLFGKTLSNKTNQWESISIRIKNIERTLYILPRLKNKCHNIEHGERFTLMEVYQELDNKRSILGINKFAVIGEVKKYCFRERKDGVPSKAKYLKVCYSFDNPSFTGHGETYSKIFGARNTALEIFMLEKQIMGPCWLRLPFKKPNRIVTWCKQELMNENIDNIGVLSSNYPS